MKSPLDYIAPFFMAGLTIVLFVMGFFIFSYILIFAAVVGLILFIVAYIRVRFFMPKNNEEVEPFTQKESGRLIEHDEQDNEERK